MAELKTRPTEASVEEHIAAIENPVRRADCEVLDALMRRVTGTAGRIWGPSIVGYDSYAYRYKSGNCGEWMRTGFANRKAALSIYVMPNLDRHADLLARIGKHKTGRCCLYVKKLADIDMGVLEEMLKRSLAELEAIWPDRKLKA